jgi:hypothetical protein
VARRALARVWQKPYSALRLRRIVEVMALDADPLVGRQAEVELLAASLEAASQEQPRFTLVVGEAGIGKTRLLREAADLAVPLGLRVLRGTAIEAASRCRTCHSLVRSASARTVRATRRRRSSGGS